MVEQKGQIPQKVRFPQSLDYKRMLLTTNRMLQPLDLSRREKAQLLITVCDTLFPRMTRALRVQAGISKDRYWKSIESVFGSPKLFIAFSDLVSQLTDDPLVIIRHEERPIIHPKDIRYEHSWQETPAAQKGESERRFLAILNEHKSRYPDMPVTLSKVAAAMGGVSRTLACNLWIKLEKQKQIPEGITKRPATHKPHQKSA